MVGESGYIIIQYYSWYQLSWSKDAAQMKWLSEISKEKVQEMYHDLTDWPKLL